MDITPLDGGRNSEVHSPQRRPSRWRRLRWRWRFRLRRFTRIASSNRWTRVGKAFAVTAGVGVVTGGLRGDDAGIDSTVVAAVALFNLYLILELSLWAGTAATAHTSAGIGAGTFALALVVLSIAWGLELWPNVQRHLLCSPPQVTGVHISDATPLVNEPVTVSLSAEDVGSIEWLIDDSAGEIVSQDGLEVAYRPKVVGSHTLRADITATCRAESTFLVPLVVDR